MKKKNLIYLVLFCLFLGINYLNVWQFTFNDLVSYGKELSIFQLWSFHIFGCVLNTVILYYIVFLFAYYSRQFKTTLSVVFSILITYITPLTIILFKVISSDGSFFDGLSDLDSDFYILLSLQIIGILLASYFGNLKAKNLYYNEEKNENLHIFGIKKWVLALLVISFNPVVNFVIKLTMVRLYDFTLIISSGKFWDHVFSFENIFSEDSSGIYGLLTSLFSIVVVWFIGGYLFYWGLYAIKNKTFKYRILTIICIYVLIPAFFIFIPLFRNRTWFF